MLVYPEKHSRHVTLAQETMRWGLMIIRVILTSYELWDDPPNISLYRHDYRMVLESICFLYTNINDGVQMSYYQLNPAIISPSLLTIPLKPH